MISEAAREIQDIANSGTANAGADLNRVLASVVDLLDVTLSPEEILESRLTRIHTLDPRGAFHPERRDALNLRTLSFDMCGSTARGTVRPKVGSFAQM